MAEPSQPSQATPFDDASMASIFTTLTDAHEVCFMMHPSTGCTDFLWHDHGDGGLLPEQEGGTHAVDALLASICDTTGQEGGVGKDVAGVVSVPGGSRNLHKATAPPVQRSRHATASQGRFISNGTCLSLLHIPKGMLQQLKLSTMFPMHAGRRASQCTVNMVSAESGASHAVTMVTKVTSPGNRHQRFTTGWSKFCELAGLEIGMKFASPGRDTKRMS